MMASLAELGEIAKGAWGKNYKEHDYGQDDMRNYHQGRYLAGAGAAAGLGSAGYAVHSIDQALKDPETQKATNRLFDASSMKDIRQYGTDIAGTRHLKNLRRAKVGAKLGGAALLAAPVVGVANAARKRGNKFRNGKSNF